MDLKYELHHSDSVFLAALGGLGEIGMNMMAFVHKGRAIIVDCGVLFPENNQIGLDLIIPKVDFFDEFDIEVDGIFLTHAHEDHVGAAPFLYEALGSPPLFGTEFTLAMIEQRMYERTKISAKDFKKIKVGESVKAGAFKVETLTVTHSLVDTVGLAIYSPQGLIIHSGDFKIDPQPVDGVRFDEARFKEMGRQGVELLLSDSTNVENEGWTESEGALSDSLIELIQSIKTGKIIVTLFSSNIHRIQTLLTAAERSGRKVAFCGRSVHSNVDLAERLKHLHFSRSIIVDSKHVEDMNPDEVMVISTGAQAEARSALMKMSLHLHPDVSILEGDTVIFSSRQIPGNEKKISNLVNNIYRCGARVIDHRDAFVHVSGHARQDELRSILEWSQPRHFLPVHGEYKMLVKHSEFAKKVLPDVKSLVMENGHIAEFTKKTGLVEKGKIPWAKMYLDEYRNLISEDVARERKRLAYRGLVSVNAVLSQKKLNLLDGPHFGIFGVPEEGVDLQELQDEVLELFHKSRKAKSIEAEQLEEQINLIVRRFFRKQLGIKPVIYPVISIV